MNLAGGRQVAQAQQRGDGEEALDAGRPLADDEAALEPVHPAHELVTDQEHGDEKASLHQTAGPLDAPPARAQHGPLHHLARDQRVLPREGQQLVEGTARQTAQREAFHRPSSSLDGARAA